jgi:hypothetical protein
VRRAAWAAAVVLARRLLGPARVRPRRGAQHAGRLLRAAPDLAALRRRLRVRPARRTVRLRQAGRPAVHPAGGQAARRRPGAPGRRAGHQPRRARRVRCAVRARRPAGVPGGSAGPVRHRGLRPARRRRQSARAELRERPAARYLLGYRRRTLRPRPARPRGRRQQAVRRSVRTQLRRPAALRRHAQRGAGHGRTAGRTRRIDLAVPRSGTVCSTSA